MEFEKIQKAIDSGILLESMCEIVNPPTKEDIQKFETQNSISLNNEHIQLLIEWGGSNLDQIRIHSLEQIKIENDKIYFANDYSGYQFYYDLSGLVHTYDTDGGANKKLANSIIEFINDFLFGEAGITFYGSEWVNELKEHGLA